MKNTPQMINKALAIAVLLALPISASAGLATESAQQAANYRHTTVVNLATMTGVFNAAVQEYVNSTVNEKWNNQNTNTAIGYAPYLVYSGGNQASCAPPAGSGTTVSGTVSLPSSYLPPSWSPPVSGTFCSVVWVNKPYPAEVTLQSYFVPGSKLIQSTLNSQTRMSAQYLTYHSANAIAQQYTRQTQSANPNWQVLYSNTTGNWSTVGKQGVAPSSQSTTTPSATSSSSMMMTSVMTQSGMLSGYGSSGTGTSSGTSSTTGSSTCINLSGSFSQYATPQGNVSPVPTGCK
jgi:hypothetical protein